MDATAAQPLTGDSRRPRLAAFASLAIHGGALVIVAIVAGGRVSPPHEVELTPIQVVEAPPPPPPPPSPPGDGTQVQSAANASTGTLGRHGHEAPVRSHSRAPAVADPYADLVVSYETPSGPDPGNEAGTTGAGIGTGLLGTGTGSDTGTGQFGLANIALPPPPAPSLARPPRPKQDYRSWNPRADRRFIGATIRVELRIDAEGEVRQVRILQGVDTTIDYRAAALAKRFEFYPALDDRGRATWGIHNWDFVITGVDLPFRMK